MNSTASAPFVRAAQELPAEVAKAAARFVKRLDPRDRPWWHQAHIPSAGMPVVFNGRGLVRAGVRGWLIHGQARTAFIGTEPNLAETQIGEFVAVLEGGAQVLAQLGRDFEFADA